MWNPEEIRELSRKNYEQAWLETAKYLEARGRHIKWRRGEGKPHPVMELVQKLRRILLSLDFEEVNNPCIIPEEDVKKQYGPEAPVILDRVFYLAGLPRPDIGIGREKVEAIMRVAPSLSEDDIRELQKIFREYKEGKVDSDDLVEEMVKRLEVRQEEATAILALFPELTGLEPIPTRLTLRSHMTALWFPTLAALQDWKPLPLKLFSIGLKFRREQRQDATHLYESFVASLVVMAERLSLEDGVELVRLILEELGFKDAKFVRKLATSKYYAPNMEMEVFVKHRGEWIEVGDLGLYSPVSLSNYGIRYPVFNAGLGVERLAMIIHGVNDVRVIAYPQFYAEREFTDEQIAAMISLEKKPSTKEGWMIAEAIVRNAFERAEEPSPCEFPVYEGTVLGKRVEVYVYENEPDAKLLGPAALNRIYVYDGNILGIPEQGLDHIPIIKEAREKGVRTDMTYLGAIAALAAHEIEEATKRGEEQVNIRIRMAKNPSDVNIRIEPQARRYITGKQKEIRISGPVFIGIRAKISRES